MAQRGLCSGAHVCASLWRTACYLAAQWPHTCAHARRAARARPRRRCRRPQLLAPPTHPRNSPASALVSSSCNRCTAMQTSNRHGSCFQLQAFLDRSLAMRRSKRNSANSSPPPCSTTALAKYKLVFLGGGWVLQRGSSASSKKALAAAAALVGSRSGSGGSSTGRQQQPQRQQQQHWWTGAAAAAAYFAPAVAAATSSSSGGGAVHWHRSPADSRRRCCGLLPRPNLLHMLRLHNPVVQTSLSARPPSSLASCMTNSTQRTRRVPPGEPFSLWSRGSAVPAPCHMPPRAVHCPPPPSSHTLRPRLVRPQATIGIDFLSKTMYLEDRTVRLQLWCVHVSAGTRQCCRRGGGLACLARGRAEGRAHARARRGVASAHRAHLLTARSRRGSSNCPAGTRRGRSASARSSPRTSETLQWQWWCTM